MGMILLHVHHHYHHYHAPVTWSGILGSVAIVFFLAGLGIWIIDRSLNGKWR